MVSLGFKGFWFRKMSRCSPGMMIKVSNHWKSSGNKVERKPQEESDGEESEVAKSTMQWFCCNKFYL